MLNRSFPIGDAEVEVARVIQDLNVIVAEVDNGALVHLEDPNYALLGRATATIKSLLGRVLARDLAGDLAGHSHAAAAAAAATTTADHLLQVQVPSNEEDWMPWDNLYVQEFEEDFWANLAEHPFLTGFGSDAAQ